MLKSSLFFVSILIGLALPELANTLGEVLADALIIQIHGVTVLADEIAVDINLLDVLGILSPKHLGHHILFRQLDSGVAGEDLEIGAVAFLQAAYIGVA